MLHVVVGMDCRPLDNCTVWADSCTLLGAGAAGTMLYQDTRSMDPDVHEYGVPCLQ